MYVVLQDQWLDNQSYVVTTTIAGGQSKLIRTLFYNSDVTQGRQLTLPP